SFILSASCLFSVIWFIYCYDHFPWNFLRKLIVCLCYTYHELGIVEVVQRMVLIGSILRAFEAKLSSVLSREAPNVADDIKKCLHIISIIHNNIFLLMESLTFLLYAWSIVAIIHLIFTVYTLLMYED